MESHYVFSAVYVTYVPFQNNPCVQWCIAPTWAQLTINRELKGLFQDVCEWKSPICTALWQACQTASLWLGIMLQNNDPTPENISYILGWKDFYLAFYDLREPYLLNILWIAEDICHSLFSKLLWPCTGGEKKERRSSKIRPKPLIPEDNEIIANGRKESC